MGDDGCRMMLAILVITLLVPGLAFLIFIVFQAMLLGKAHDKPEGNDRSPRSRDGTKGHEGDAEL